MKLILLLFGLVLFSFVVQGTIAPPKACPGQREDLLSCFQMLDIGSGGNITIADLDVFFTAGYAPEGCLPQQSEFQDSYNSSVVMQLCDVDANDVLDMADWNSADGCLYNEGSRAYVCRMCYMCGWPGPSK
jgi:hypothetical protein